MSLTLAAFLLQMLYFPNFGNCSCRPVRYFGIFFQDDITKFWDENLLLFTFSTGKLRKNLFWNNNQFVHLNFITNFRPKKESEYIVRIFS